MLIVLIKELCVAIVSVSLLAVCCFPRQSSIGVGTLVLLLVSQVPGDATGGEVTIACQFNQTDATEVQVVPAAVAQAAGSQNGATASPVDDLIDDFAAGDAAVQVPVSVLP